MECSSPCADAAPSSILPPRQRHALPESEAVTPKTWAWAAEDREAEAMRARLAQSPGGGQAQAIDNRQERTAREQGWMMDHLPRAC